MNEPHRIRLRGPWQVKVIESFDPEASLPPPTQMTIPCSWRDGGWPGFRGRASHSRSFGRPTGIGPNEHVRLMVEPLLGSGTVRLNGQLLGVIDSNSTFSCEVTGQLNARNLLEIELVADGDWGGITHEVRIEIRSSGGEGN